MGLIPDQEDTLQDGMAAHSSNLAWRIPWTEEPGRLQSIGSQRVAHDKQLSALTHIHTHTHTHADTHISTLAIVVTQPTIK